MRCGAQPDVGVSVELPTLTAEAAVEYDAAQGITLHDDERWADPSVCASAPS